MKPKLLIISLIIISLIFAGCRKNQEEKSTPAEELRSSAQETSSPAGPETQPSSFSDFEEGVKIYREALSAKDPKKCKEIKVSSLKTKCLEEISE